MRDGLRRAITDTGASACVTGFGASWMVYFRDQEPRNYLEALDHDEARASAYNRECARPGSWSRWSGSATDACAWRCPNRTSTRRSPRHAGRSRRSAECRVGSQRPLFAKHDGDVWDRLVT